MENTVSRVDLHVHTAYSKDTQDWRIKLVGAQESYSTPRQVVRDDG